MKTERKPRARAKSNLAGKPPARSLPADTRKPDVKSRAVLLAVMGTSPAILTETVWALAQGDDRHPPVIPDEVVAITTCQGRDKINAQLLASPPDGSGQSIWQSLRRTLLGADAVAEPRLTLRIEVIARPAPLTGQLTLLTDILTLEDNLAAAEFIFQHVRAHVSADDTRLIASLAGGRKTMSSLLHATFSHLARPQDRLTHILVNEPFDGAVQPLFFYPGQPQQKLTDRGGKVWTARDARLLLADVPFAPMRLRFPDIEKIPMRFHTLLKTYSETWQRDATEPARIELHHTPPRVVVDGLSVELESERQLTVIQFLLRANRERWVQKNQDEALAIFKATHGYPPESGNVPPALKATLEKLSAAGQKKPGPEWIKNATTDDIKRPLSYWRRLLEKKGSRWVPPKRDLRFPPFELV
ncbi:MAG: CRISPR-associated ring nuclease Csm6 [Verrucomicrobiae bacterium]|nr:CRISPR-associated ring nuclease Csm6 [Verrucomicrobiae bacterium]